MNGGGGSALGIKERDRSERFTLPMLTRNFGSGQSTPWAPVILHALADSWSRQHVLQHACGLSTLLSDAWQIDSVAAAVGGISEHVVALSYAGPDVQTELTSVAECLLATTQISDSQLAKERKGSQKYFNRLKSSESSPHVK